MTKHSALLAILLTIDIASLPGCSVHREEHQHHDQQITVTRPVMENVTLVQPFVCQIHSQRHIQLQALERGYLEEIKIKEGQSVKAGDPLFTVRPILYKAKLDAESAEARQAQLEYNYSKKLADDKVISQNEAIMVKTKLARAEANVKLAEAELDFATVRAPFDGIIDRLFYQQGSLVEKGDILTNLSDNSLMWVYFNVPETRYLKYKADFGQHTDHLKIELLLADGKKFNQPGKFGTIEADFDNTTGNIPFRADFPNPDRLLRNGQTGTILISRVQKDAIVIPQRATFEHEGKLCIYVVDKNDIVHRKEITVKDELEDLFVVESGVSIDDKIIFEGIRQAHNGDQVKYQERATQDVYEKLKFHAE